MKRVLGVLCFAIVVASGCAYSDRVATGHEPPLEIRIPDPVELTWKNFFIRLDPTVLVWADQSGVDLRRVVATSLARIHSSLRGSPVEISIAAGSFWKIPNVGIGGNTDRANGNVSISMDARRPTPVRDLLTVWLPVALAHELHHSKRIRDGPGYGSTLLDAMVAEGSAEAFVRETFPDAPAIPWVQPLGEGEQRRLWLRAARVLNAPDDIDLHNTWFIGGGSLPPWPGYRLGYAIAGAYLERHRHVTAGSLATMPTARIYDGSGFARSMTTAEDR